MSYRNSEGDRESLSRQSDQLSVSETRISNYITAALIRQLPLKAVTETLRNNREAVILVGVKSNVKNFFKGLVEANLAAQQEARGYNRHLR